MSDQTTLERYVLSRGLVDPAWATEGEKEAKENDEILDNEEILAGVAGMILHNDKALKAILRAVMKPIAIKLLFTSIPHETMVLRQAMVEVGGIYDIIEKYRAEYERRHPADGSNNADKSADDGGL